LLATGLLLGAAVLAPLAAAAGLFGPRSYLLLAQDSAELRPYGGFVGTYGVVELRWGRIAGVDYGDSLALDDVYDERLDEGEIEEPFEPRHLYAASDSPDFPTAARAIAETYRKITGDRIDGVVALDPEAASGLLELVGPLAVPGEAEPFTASNVLGLVLKHTQNFESEVEDVERKQIVFDLGSTLASRLRELPLYRWPQVAAALGRAADERHIQAHFRNPLLQSWVRRSGWDGAYRPLPPGEDFLAVVDSNEGYNKANLVTGQSLDYRVVLGPSGEATATLTVAYRNRGTAGLGFSTAGMPYLHQATYEAGVQVYAPPGSRRLVGAPAAPAGDGPDEPDSDLGRAVFQQRVAVSPERTETLTFAYRLPDRPAAGGRIDYLLSVRKQAGTVAVPFRLTVVGPDGWRVMGTAGGNMTAETTLVVDRRFAVSFAPVG
jgi:hypothetical protein